MEKKNEIRYGLLSAMIIMSITAGIIVLSDTEMDKAYTCSITGVTGVFENLSGNVGYWNNGNDTLHSTCTKGEWIPRREYCRQNNISKCNEFNLVALNDLSTNLLWCDDKFGCDEIVSQWVIVDGS